MATGSCDPVSRRLPRQHVPTWFEPRQFSLRACTSTSDRVVCEDEHIFDEFDRQVVCTRCWHSGSTNSPPPKKRCLNQGGLGEEKKAAELSSKSSRCCWDSLNFPRRAKYGSESKVSITKLSEFFGPHRLLERAQRAPLSPLYVCVPNRTH